MENRLNMQKRSSQANEISVFFLTIPLFNAFTASYCHRFQKLRVSPNIVALTIAYFAM